MVTINKNPSTVLTFVYSIFSIVIAMFLPPGSVIIFVCRRFVLDFFQSNVFVSAILASSVHSELLIIVSIFIILSVLDVIDAEVASWDMLVREGIETHFECAISIGDLLADLKSILALHSLLEEKA